jgi:phosphoribosylaminoimidazole-succinocarboxamide synthase
VPLASKKLLDEIGAKRIYEGESEDQLIITFSDNMVDADGNVKGKVKGKAAKNNDISSQIFEYLESYNVMTHFVSKLNDKDMQVKKCELLPLKIVISNAVEKSLSKKFGIKEGSLLPAPIVEYYYKNDKLKNPIVNESHMNALNLIGQEEVHFLGRTVVKVNAVLKSFFERRNMILSELRLSLGRYRGYLLVADEITPDTCKFWSIDGENNIDRDVFHYEKGKPDAIYQNIASQIGVGE